MYIIYCTHVDKVRTLRKYMYVYMYKVHYMLTMYMVCRYMHVHKNVHVRTVGAKKS